MGLIGLTHRDHDDQHQRGAVGIPELLALPRLAALDFGATREKFAALLLRLLHRAEEQDVEDDERHARDQVDEEHAKPENEHHVSISDLFLYDP